MTSRAARGSCSAPSSSASADRVAMRPMPTTPTSCVHGKCLLIPLAVSEQVDGLVSECLDADRHSTDRFLSSGKWCRREMVVIDSKEAARCQCR